MILQKYRTIYADPPWMESGGGKIKRGADRHYPLMRTSEIAGLGDFVKSISSDNSHLYLWVTNNFLPDGLTVMHAWGYRYVTMITWMKDRIGLGQYYRGMTEHCLFGVKGNCEYRLKPDGKRAQGRTGFIASAGRHSEKPKEMREMIELVSWGPRLEMFARCRVEGWEVWGNEV